MDEQIVGGVEYGENNKGQHSLEVKQPEADVCQENWAQDIFALTQAVISLIGRKKHTGLVAVEYEISNCLYTALDEKSAANYYEAPLKLVVAKVVFLIGSPC